MSEWVYLSYPLKEQTPLYGNSGKLKFQRIRQIQNGESSNNTELHFPAHSGTHLDAQFYFDGNGKSLDEYTADNWEFDHTWLISYPTQKATILDFLMLEHELEAIPMETDLLLIKTDFSSYRNSKNSF
jgi:kynurenine formamidase